MNQPINCIILCGGKGSRMNSDLTHKVCFNIAGMPAIHRLIGDLKCAGIKRFFVVVGSMAGNVIECIGNSFDDVVFVYQKNPLGTGDAVIKAVNVIQNLNVEGPIMVVMGDKIIKSTVIENLISEFKRTEANAVLVVQPKTFNPSGGRAIIDSNGRFKGICESIDSHTALLYQRLSGQIRNNMTIDTNNLLDILNALSKELFYSEKKKKRVLSTIMTELSQIEDDLFGKTLLDKLESKQWVNIGGIKYDPKYIEESQYINAATYLFKQSSLIGALRRLSANNSQGEVYLTDALNILANSLRENDGHCPVHWIQVESQHQIMSFNTVEELLEIENYFIQSTKDKDTGIPRSILKPIDEWLDLFYRMPDILKEIFNEVYGDDKSLLEERRIAYIEALNSFKRKFGAEREVIITRAPGRVNLMGRHVEHRGGYVNVISINKEIIAVASPRDDDTVNISNADPEFPDRAFRISDHLSSLEWKDWISFIESHEIQKMVLDSKGDWINYVKAAVLKLQYTFHDRKLKGMDMLFSGNIPMAAGLSSSSAMVVATAEASVVVNQLDVSPQKFVDLCGEGEWFVGSRGGAGDHAAMKFGSRGYIAHLGFFPFGFRGAIKFPTECKLVIANSYIKAQKTTNAKDLFNQRIASYEFSVMLVRNLFPQYAPLIKHLRDINPENLGIMPSKIYEMLLQIPEKIAVTDLFNIFPEKDHSKIKNIMSTHAPPKFYEIRSVLLYGISECRRSKICEKVLSEGDFKRFGKLMEVSHNGDRVAYYKDSKMFPYDWSVTDDYLQSLIMDLKSENPIKVSNAQIEMQPGGYACSKPEIDYMVDLTKNIPGVIGSQLSGAGLGGCIMILAESGAVSQLIDVLNREYYHPKGLPEGTTVCSPVKGSMVWSV